MAISITPAPTLPDLNDPATFNSRAIALFGWIAATFIDDLEAITASDIIETSIDGVPIGATSPNTGKFTTLEATGLATFGGNAVPVSDSTKDLGTTSVRWRNAYIDELAGITNKAASVAELGLSKAMLFATCGGTANAITLTTGITATANITDAPIRFQASNSNTSTTVTINRDGIGTVPVKDLHGNDPVVGYIRSGVFYEAIFNGTNYVVHPMTQGTRVLIADFDASGDAVFEATWGNSVFRRVIVEFDYMVPTTDGIALQSRVSDDDGATWIDSAIYETAGREQSSDGTQSAISSTGINSIYVTSGNVGSAANEVGVSGQIILHDPSLTKYTHIDVRSGYSDNAGNYVNRYLGVQVPNADVVNGLQLNFGTGNIESGKVRVWGEH